MFLEDVSISSGLVWEVLSNHLLILLQLEGSNQRSPLPFKFNHTRLNEESFRKLVLSN
jgi:hypothetical protein